VALAGACCCLDRNDLHARFVDHSKEERGHEKVAIADIKSLGFSLEDFPKVYPSQAMFQVQYYWVQHVNPVSFFGYTYALEMLAVKFGAEVFGRVLKAHGEKSVKFLKLHSEDDVDHMATADKLISKLTPEETKFAMENMTLSSQLYRQMLIEGQKISLPKPMKKSA
jgi:pyrroloquinoline quinone (PQQ) biosynthesis protein C